MPTKFGSGPCSREPSAHEKTKDQGTPHKSGRVEVPSPGGRKENLLFEFFDRNLKSSDYRRLLHKADKDAK